jgi:hypothetical protein
MVSYIFEISSNNPSKKGSLAGAKILFGEYSRYAVAPIHTRFDDVEWFVWDAHKLDENGTPEVIRQEPTFEAAVAGL